MEAGVRCELLSRIKPNKQHPSRHTKTLPGAPYDVWAVHTKYDSVLFDDFISSTRRVVTIIRDP